MLHVFVMIEDSTVRTQGKTRYKHTKGIYHKNLTHQALCLLWEVLMGRHGDFQVL